MKMKKNAFCKGIVAACMVVAAMMMLSSCLEGGGNKMTDTTAGVIRFDDNTFKNVLDVSEYESLYAPTFDNMAEGACCFVYYELDFEDPENTSEMVAAHGYYWVTIMDKAEVERFYMLSSLDTSSVALEKELAVTNPVYQVNGYVKGVLFVTHQLVMAEDQKITWRLSGDYQNPAKDDSGSNVYDVYLRAVERIESSKTHEESYATYAYDMKYFFQNAARAEKALGKDRVAIRFNYVSKIEDGVATWDKISDPYEFSLELLLPE